jgi:predicted CopG family antitoxin
MSDRTTVSVKPDTADQLHDLKDRGESFDDVIRSLLNRAETPDTAPAQ